jgi:O-antigen ligase
LIASIIGLIQFIEESYRYEVVGRIFGWLGGSYGAVIGSTFMLCLAVLLYEQRLGLRLLSIITLPIVSLALILSQTRAWIGAVAIASFLMLFWTHRQLFIKAVIILGASIIFLFFVYQTDIANTVIKNQISYAFESAFRFDSEGQRATTDVSLWMRLNVLNIAFNLFLQHPITGIGVGNLRFDEHIIGKLGAPAVGVGFVDNQYIQFFTEAGFIAGIVFLLLVFRILKTGFTAVKFSKATPLYSSAFGLLAVLFVFLIGGFFWVVTSDHESFALMIMFIATQANIARLSTPQNLESSDLDRM